jgi:hypothetical protein
MQLPKAPATYSASDQAQLRGTLEREDNRNMKNGVILDKLLFRDTATGAVVTVVVTSGAFVIS